MPQTDQQAKDALVRAGLDVRDVSHDRRDDEGRLVTWAQPPPDEDKERAQQILSSYSIGHAAQ